jgi:hypothetical protein
MSEEDQTSEILLQLDIMRCHLENARNELNQAIHGRRKARYHSTFRAPLARRIRAHSYLPSPSDGCSPAVCGAVPSCVLYALPSITRKARFRIAVQPGQPSAAQQRRPRPAAAA